LSLVIIHPQICTFDPALASAFARATTPPLGSCLTRDSIPIPFDRRLARINAEDPATPRPFDQFLREQNTRLALQTLAFRAACALAAIHQHRQHASPTTAHSAPQPPRRIDLLA
jgi:hypothetical protein